MRHMVIMVCVISCIALVIIDRRVTGQVADGIRLECVKVERVDAGHFRAVVELVNGSKSDIYVQSAMDRGDTPYPVYLERRVESDQWQIVAPCVDLMPAGAIAVMKGKSITMDRVHSLELPSNCRTRSIDPSREYRWRVDYFASRSDLRRYQETRGHSGMALSIVSEPFLIRPENKRDRSPN